MILYLVSGLTDLGWVLGLALLPKGQTVPVVSVLRKHQHGPELRGDVPHEARVLGE